MTQIFDSLTGSDGNVRVLTLVIGIEPELFQARLCSLYLVTEYLVTKPHQIRSTGIMRPA